MGTEKPDSPKIGNIPVSVGGNMASSVLSLPDVVENISTIAQPVQQGKAIDSTVASANVLKDVTEIGATMAKLAGKNTAIVDGALERVAIPFTIANGIHKVSQEKGFTHQMERVVDVSATTAAAVGVTTALEGGLLLSGGTMATGGLAMAGAAAPVVVAAGAVYVTGKAAELAIDTRRIYEDIDNTFHPAPDFRHASQSVSLLRNELAASGVNVSDSGRMDLADPQNRAVLREVIATKQVALGQTIRETDSLWPRWVRSSDEAGVNGQARSDVAFYDTALSEITNLENIDRMRTSSDPLGINTLPPAALNSGIVSQNMPPLKVEIPSTPVAVKPRSGNGNNLL